MMSKAYEMISESLNELINDLEEHDGKNLKREIVSTDIKEAKNPPKAYKISSDERYFEQTINF